MSLIGGIDKNRRFRPSGREIGTIGSKAS